MYLLALGLCLFGASRVAHSDPPIEPAHLPGLVLVVLTPEAESATAFLSGSDMGARRGLPSLDGLFAEHGVSAYRESAVASLSDVAQRRYILSLPAGQELTLLRALEACDDVEAADLVRVYPTALTPDDPYWPLQWNYDSDHINAVMAWDVEHGTSTVSVGIIDTGLDYNHPDLVGNVWSGMGHDWCGAYTGPPWYCSFQPDSDPQHVTGGEHSHGTKVAGAISARADNSSFVAGLAGGWGPAAGVQLLGLRAGYDLADGTGGGVYNHLAADAIDWAVAQSTAPLVLNMSFVGKNPSSALETSINAAWSTGRVVLVGAALGRSVDSLAYPAAYENTVAVTGVTELEAKGGESGFGTYVDLCAPVDGVPTVAYNTATGQHIYWATRGTTPSISAAQVSGLAALVWSRYPGLSNKGVVRQLLATADSAVTYAANPGYLGQLGKGRINAYRALTEWSDTLFARSGHTLVWDGAMKLTGDVVVPAGTTLQIQPGSVIQAVATSDRSNHGNFPTKAELIVYGTLQAEGVTFQSADPGYSWGGIVMAGSGNPATTPNSYIRNCTIEHAQYGTLIQASNWTLGGTDVAQENHYVNCTYGVLVDNAGGAYTASGNTLRNLHIEGSPWGIALWDADNTTVQQVLVHDLVAGGVGVRVDSSSTGVLVTNVTIADVPYEQGTGVLWQGGSSGTVKNTLAKGLNGGGVRSIGGGSVDVLHYLGYQNNGLGNELLGIDVADVKALWSNPRLNGDYTLQSNSPGLDLGDPSQADPNSSRRDVGRYGGTSLAGTAAGSVVLEDYFVNGSASGWQALTATSGSWAGNAAAGTYKVTGVTGQSLSYRTVAASSYTIETRMKFGGLWGTAVYAQADEWDQWRLDLMAAEDQVRLHTPTGWHTASYTINPDTWYDVRLEVDGGVVHSYINGTHLHNGVSLGGMTPDGAVGIGSYGPTHNAEFDHVVVMNGSGTGGGSAASTDYALDFTAANRHEVDVGLVTTSGTNKYTVEAWVMVSSGSGIYEIVGQNGVAGDCKGTLIILDGKVRFELSTPGYTALFSSGTVTPNAWTHVAGVYNGSQMRVYINGTLSGQVAKSGNITTYDFAGRSTRIGGYAGSGSTGCPYWFDGQIDEVRIWNTARTQQQLQANMEVEIAGQDGLIGYWRLDDEVGSMAIDHSGNGHTGTLTNRNGQGTPTWEAGGFEPGGGGPPPTNSCLSFTASSRHEVSVGRVTTSGTQYTAEAWVKVSSSSGIYEIVGQNAGGGDCKGTLIILDGKVRFEVSTPGYTALYSNGTVTPNVWTHVAGVYDGNTMKVYRNGSLDGQVSKSGSITTQDYANRSTRLGGYAGTCSCPYWFGGRIDEVRIWSVARAQSQLQAHMHVEIPAQSYLIGYWRFNEGSGSTTEDHSGHGHTGTLTNYAGSGTPTWKPDGFPAGKPVAVSARPATFALRPNHPNPFNPETVLRYEIPAAQQVRLAIFNLLGQRVVTLVDAEQVAGPHQARWDGRDESGHPQASGVYVYRLMTPGGAASRKMTLLR